MSLEFSNTSKQEQQFRNEVRSRLTWYILQYTLINVKVLIIDWLMFVHISCCFFFCILIIDEAYDHFEWTQIVISV